MGKAEETRALDPELQAEFDRWYETAKQLRRAYNAAHHALMEHIDGLREEVWKAAGWSSLDQFVEHLGLAKGSEYRAWKNGRVTLLRVVPDVATKVSYETTKRIARLDGDDGAVREAVERDRSFEAANGVPASETAANGIVRAVKAARATARNSHRSYADLAKENETLRERLAARDEEIKTLKVALKAALSEKKKELAALRRELKELRPKRQSK